MRSAKGCLLLSAFLIGSLACCHVQNCGAASPAGRWSGGWSSQSTGHRGTLRARIRPVDDNTYRALFAGRFAKVIPFVYPAKLHRVSGSTTQYTSTTRLPLLGTYRMNATVSPSHFYATFRGRRDTGVFEMNR